jgi:hypothetical protein
LEKNQKVYIREARLRRPIDKKVLEKMEEAKNKTEAKKILKEHLQKEE